MAYDWNTMPMPRYSGATFRRVALENTTWLPIRISPASGVTRPATQRSRVVFPEPLGPSSTKNSLSPTSMSTPRSAATLVVCPGNIFSTPCTLIIESPSADYSLASNDQGTSPPERMQWAYTHKSSIRSNSSNRSKRFEQLEQLERFEPNSTEAHPSIDTLSWLFLASWIILTSVAIIGLAHRAVIWRRPLPTRKYRAINGVMHKMVTTMIAAARVLSPCHALQMNTGRVTVPLDTSSAAIVNSR